MGNNIFEEMAKRYDTEERKALADVIVKEVRQALGNSEQKSLLDYGSGTGLVGLELVDLVASVLLVDASEKMIELADGKIINRKIANAKAMCSDFTEETPHLKVDVILVSLVLLHIPDTRKILTELFSLLNHGGKLIIVDFDKNDQVSHPKIHNGFTHEELKGILAEVGFESTEVKTFYEGTGIFAKQDASMFIASSMK